MKQDDCVSPILFNLSFQKMIHSLKMVPSDIKFGKEQLTVLAYADDIVLIGKDETDIRQLFVEIEKHCQKVRTTDKPRKNKICDSGTEKQFKTK